MAPELRKRKAKPAVAEPEAVTKKAKMAKATPKVEKRKASEDASPVTVKKQKSSKDAATNKKAAAALEDKAAPKKSALKKDKHSPKAQAGSQKSKKVAEPEKQQNEEAQSGAEEEEVDDDTKALVEALDSGDEDEQVNQARTYKEGQDVGKIPKAKKSTKSTKPSGGSEKPGVMYLARIPHGFYEHELRSYFGQFGEITRLRVVRNKKTGASKHRAFIEFADAEVADIAARTMDKYLLFGHILTAKVVPPAQVHPNLFKGANRRFKVVPWNKMAGRQLERPLSESQWQVKISKEEQRRAARAEKLKAMGYEFESPQLKAAEAKPMLENGTDEAPKAIEAATVAEKTEPKEEKQVVAPEAVEAKEEATPQKKKGKKGKKTKS